jgi:hypothetical protein
MHIIHTYTSNHHHHQRVASTQTEQMVVNIPTTAAIHTGGGDIHHHKVYLHCNSSFWRHNREYLEKAKSSGSVTSAILYQIPAYPYIKKILIYNLFNNILTNLTVQYEVHSALPCLEGEVENIQTLSHSIELNFKQFRFPSTRKVLIYI